MKFIIPLCLLFITTSCNFFYSAITGIKNSRYESETYQKKYLVSNGIDTSYMAFFKTNYYDSLAHAKYSLDTFKNMGYTPIQFRVFDINGNLLSGWEICFGNAEKAGVYANFPHSVPSRWPLNPKLSLFSDFGYINPINFNLEQIRKSIEEKKYDYIIVSFWAGYLGKHSANMLRNLDQVVRTSQKVLHIKVNLSD